MFSHLSFSFRGENYPCGVMLDATGCPGYVFMVFSHPTVVAEFGDELTITTDFHELLHTPNDPSSITELRQAIFEVLRLTPEFLLARQAYLLLSPSVMRDC